MAARRWDRLSEGSRRRCLPRAAVVFLHAVSSPPPPRDPHRAPIPAHEHPAHAHAPPLRCAILAPHPLLFAGVAPSSRSSFYGCARCVPGPSPSPAHARPTVALTAPKRRHARCSPCGHLRRLCSRPPLAHALWLARVRRDPFARCARARRARRTTSAAPTTPRPLLAGGSRTTHPFTPPLPSLTHSFLSISTLTTPSTLFPPRLSSPLSPPPPHKSPRGRASGMGWYSSFFVFNIA